MAVDKDVKNAAAAFLMTNIAGVVARQLAKLSPDKARELLGNKTGLIGMKLPDEFVSTLGGSVAGLTIVKVLGMIFPNLSSEYKDYIVDFATMVGDEYEDVIKLRDATAASTSTATAIPTAVGGRITMEPVFYQYAVFAGKPKIAFWTGCSCKHHLENIRGKEMTVSGFSIRGFLEVLRDLQEPPRTTDDGWEDGCGCLGAFQKDTKAYEAALAAAKPVPPPAPKPAPEPEPVSFTGWIGWLIRGKVSGVGPEDTRRLLGLLGQIPSNELTPLVGEINSASEIAALSVAKDVDELRTLLQGAADRKQTSRFADTLGLPHRTAHTILDKAKAADAGLTTWANMTAAAIEKRTADRKTARELAAKAVGVTASAVGTQAPSWWSSKKKAVVIVIIVVIAALALYGVTKIGNTAVSDETEEAEEK